MKSLIRPLTLAALLGLTAGTLAVLAAPAPVAAKKKAAAKKEEKPKPPEKKEEKKAEKKPEKPAEAERKGPASFGSGASDLSESERTSEADVKRDEAIEKLKKVLSNPNMQGPQKGELLFRLAELWIQKSKYMYFSEMGAYDTKYKAFLECVNQKGSGKCGSEPKIENRKSELYRDEALRLYDQILKDYPTYDRKDEVLFALATNLYEKGRKDDAIAKHRDLVTQYPKSQFVGDSYVAMGEHYFAANDLVKARAAYEKARDFTRDREPRIYNFSLYKLAWCDYNGGDYDGALKKFKEVVDRSEGSKKKNEVALKGEALNDMILTWQKLDAIDEANSYYKSKTSKEKARGYFSKLANKYFDDGGHDSAIKAYRLLIQEEANDPKCPGFQANIVKAFEGLRQRDKVLAEMKTLVKNYKPGSGWAAANASNKAALASAYEVTEGAMRELVTDYHQEAQKTKEVRTYRVAGNIYKEYLDSFSDSEHAYNLQYYYAEILWTLEDWERAAEQYEAAYKRDAKGSYSRTAAYNSLLCYEKLIAIEKGELDKTELKDTQKVDEKKDKGAVKKTKKEFKTGETFATRKEEAIPKWEQKLIEACDRYADIAADDKRLEGDEINVRYKAAFIYYDRNHFTDAARRFGDIILKWPTDPQAQKAADLSLNILETKEQWQDLARLSRAFYENKKLAKPGDKWSQELAKIMEGAQYKYIDIVVYKQEKNVQKAAPMFRDFVKEFPKSPYADQALVYSMVIYQEAKQLDQAIAVGEQILQEYPDTKFRSRATLDLASFYQQTSDFAKAAAFYERFYQEWEAAEQLRAPIPRDEKGKEKDKKKKQASAGPFKKYEDVIKAKKDEAVKASDALYNAALWNEGLGNYEKAIGFYNEYIAHYRTVKDAVAPASLAFNIALIYEKQKDWPKFEAALASYIKDYEKSVTAGKIFYARYQRAMTLEKLKKHEDSVKLLEVCIKEFPKVPADEQKTFTLLDAYAHARFLMLEPKWAAYQRIKLANVKTLKADLKAKVAATPPMINDFTEVLKIGSADWGIAALTRIGQVNADFSKNFLDSPDPPGLDEEQLEMYRAELENRAFPLEEKAIEAWEKALQKSYELSIYNEFTIEAQNRLNKFRQGEYGEIRTASYTGSEFFSRAGVAATADATFGSEMQKKARPDEPKAEEKKPEAKPEKVGIGLKAKGAKQEAKEEAPDAEDGDGEDAPKKKKKGIILKPKSK